MRKSLHALYRACGALAGAALVAMLAMIALNIAGGVFGFFIRGLDAYAGYLMAAASFLALAYTLKAGEHIRVTLLLLRLPTHLRRGIEIACLLLAATITGYFAWHSVDMVYISWRLGDVSQATDQTPLWIPQSLMAFGVVVLFIAFVEETIDEVMGRRKPPPKTDVPAHIE
ncbi:MAG TPA: TRAP transporter small permease [Sinorhizobium sp.]|nr:TRAP transporter small permease [Sinorhizobium sp.]